MVNWASRLVHPIFPPWVMSHVAPTTPMLNVIRPATSSGFVVFSRDSITFFRVRARHAADDGAKAQAKTKCDPPGGKRPAARFSRRKLNRQDGNQAG
ncbi:hypothetical protein BBAD15_g266 [Beauveria bassiana D1-5]|uniref:Uncharacterized protein n=1 Tax=Beauveria bassiana D1-5 TaxID=1245745 RepID=A0A0A2W5S4_BEABA|nr:hypothetical protein BBAD15_g266 [Beauveria bassiana D1-5]